MAKRADQSELICLDICVMRNIVKQIGDIYHEHIAYGSFRGVRISIAKYKTTGTLKIV